MSTGIPSASLANPLALLMSAVMMLRHLAATRKDPVDWIAWRRLADQTTDPERFHALQMAARLNPKATRRSLGHEDRVRLGLTGSH